MLSRVRKLLPIVRIHRLAYAPRRTKNILNTREMSSEMATMKRKVETGTSIDDTSLKHAKLGDTDANVQVTGTDTEMTIQNAETNETEKKQDNTSQRNEKEGGRGRGRGKGKGKDKSEKEKVWESRRRRGTRVEGDSEQATGVEGSTEEKAPRLPKRQSALLIGFCGSGYNGMQMFVFQVTQLRYNS